MQLHQSLYIAVSTNILYEAIAKSFCKYTLPQHTHTVERCEKNKPREKRAVYGVYGNSIRCHSTHVLFTIWCYVD